jgi:hypothetical protein
MAGEDPTSESIDVPDIKTALLVADINVASGRAEIWEGDRLIASIARQSNGPLPFWHVE